MNAVEFGKRGRQKILLIPGNMMCWRQFERVIPLLEGGVSCDRRQHGRL